MSAFGVALSLAPYHAQPRRLEEYEMEPDLRPALANSFLLLSLMESKVVIASAYSCAVLQRKPLGSREVPGGSTMSAFGPPEL